MGFKDKCRINKLNKKGKLFKKNLEDKMGKILRELKHNVNLVEENNEETLENLNNLIEFYELKMRTFSKTLKSRKYDDVKELEQYVNFTYLFLFC